MFHNYDVPIKSFTHHDKVLFQISLLFSKSENLKFEVNTNKREKKKGKKKHTELRIKAKVSNLLH